MIDAHFYTINEKLPGTEVLTLLSNNVLVKRYYIDEAALKKTVVEVPYTDGNLDLTDTILDGKKHYSNRLIEITCKSDNKAKYLLCSGKLHGKVLYTRIQDSSQSIGISYGEWWKGRVSVINFQSKDNYYEWSITVDACPYFSVYPTGGLSTKSTGSISTINGGTLNTASNSWGSENDLVWIKSTNQSFIGTEFGFANVGSKITIEGNNFITKSLSDLGLSEGMHFGVFARKGSSSYATTSVLHSFIGTTYSTLVIPSTTTFTASSLSPTVGVVPQGAATLRLMNSTSTNTYNEVIIVPLNITVTANDLPYFEISERGSNAMKTRGNSVVYVCTYNPNNNLTYYYLSENRGL